MKPSVAFLHPPTGWMVVRLPSCTFARMRPLAVDCLLYVVLHLSPSEMNTENLLFDLFTAAPLTPERGEMYLSEG